MNGVPAEAHLGHTVRDVLGDAAADVELCLQRVFDSGEPLFFDVLRATLPTRTEPGHWIRFHFPIKDATGSVERVGVLVVDVTAQRKLGEYFHDLADVLLQTQTKEKFWLARALNDSINDYHVALAMTLSRLIGESREPETNDELLALAVALLDQRIMCMRTLVAAVASPFPIDQQR